MVHSPDATLMKPPAPGPPPGVGVAAPVVPGAPPGAPAPGAPGGSGGSGAWGCTWEWAGSAADEGLKNGEMKNGSGMENGSQNQDNNLKGELRKRKIIKTFSSFLCDANSFFSASPEVVVHVEHVRQQRLWAPLLEVQLLHLVLHHDGLAGDLLPRAGHAKHPGDPLQEHRADLGFLNSNCCYLAD